MKFHIFDLLIIGIIVPMLKRWVGDELNKFIFLPLFGIVGRYMQARTKAIIKHWHKHAWGNGHELKSILECMQDDCRII